MLATSTDALRYTLRRVIPESQEPNLFHLGKFTSDEPSRRQKIIDHPEEVIKIQNNESMIVWKSVLNFVKSNLEDGFDILIEGIAVLPEFLDSITFDYSAVFLGNCSDLHFQTTYDSARTNPNDWLNSLEDETIKAFCNFNQKFSLFIQKESRKFGQKYVEVDDTNFEQSLKRTQDLLLK